MKNYSWLILIFLLLTSGCKDEVEIIPTSPDADQEEKLQTVTTVDGAITAFDCLTETLNSGEIYQICKPVNWNGELIIYAHGYVSEFKPLALPTEPDDFAPLFISMGYAFATTSYSENGLAIQTGIKNIVDLRKRFIKKYGEPEHIYLAGASEGGIVTTLAIERYPELFSGGLSLCGPCGDFQKQMNYYGDFRVLFDYYFPGVLPGNAVSIPDQLIQNWSSVYVPAILQAIALNPAATAKLLSVAQAPYNPTNPTTIGETVLGILWYDVFATRDAVNKLKGQPYDNSTRVYTVPGNPAETNLLNARVQRFTADKHASKNVQKYYQTTGDIRVPLVSAHTTGDPIVPAWHLSLYQAKTVAQGTSPLFTGILINRYGHCTFSQAEIAQGFALLVLKVTGQPLLQAQQLTARALNGKIVKSVRLAQ